jgi:toxin ParE1/3/4
MRPAFRQSRNAKRDLLAIWRFIAADSPAAADAMARRLLEKARGICDAPRMGRTRPDIRQDVRQWRVGEYLILYRETSDAVEIVRYVHGRRDITKIDF